MIKKLLLMSFLLLILTACRSVGQSISPQDAKAMMEENNQIILLDVRTKEEFDQGHIPNATLFPLLILESQITTHYPDKKQIFIIYCRSGVRSAEAVQIMLGLGYSNIYDLGGIIDWPYNITQ